MKPLSLCYFINLIGLYGLGGLMVSMLTLVNEFSRVLAGLVFDS